MKILPNSGPAAHCLKINTGVARIGRNGNGAFNQETSNLGRRDSVPQNGVPRFCLAMRVLRGKEEVRSVSHGDGGRPPLSAGSLAPCDLSLGVSCSHIPFVRLLKEVLGKRSSHLLITYSSFLLL